MGWWQQLHTFDPPEDRYQHYVYLNRDSTYVKEGTYSCAIDALSGILTDDIHGAFDLSAYPGKSKIWLWFYAADLSSVSYFRFGILDRDANYNYKQWNVGDLSTGWNHLSFTPDEVTATARYWENVMSWRFGWNCTADRTFYVDDIFITTDDTQNLDTQPTYSIKKFDRYDSGSSENHHYAGILKPEGFTFGKALNTVGEATLTFDRDSYDDLPEISDGVRIYRNGQCVWHGIVTRKEDDYAGDKAVLYCKSSERVLGKIGNLTDQFYHITASMELFDFLAKYAANADAGTTQGFDLPSTGTLGGPGYSGKTLSTDRVIDKSEFSYPIDICRNFQSQIAYDFELSPNFALQGWYPEKGYTWDMKLLQDTHFKVNKKIYSGEDLWNACRAYSRGAQAAWVGTDSDTTSMNTYGRFVKPINASHIDSQTEINSVADEFVDEYKDPATIFEVKLMQGGWMCPWDLGDTITCVVDGTEYSKRIYAMNVTVTQKGEEVGLVVQ